MFKRTSFFFQKKKKKKKTRKKRKNCVKMWKKIIDNGKCEKLNFPNNFRLFLLRLRLRCCPMILAVCS